MQPSSKSPAVDDVKEDQEDGQMICPTRSENKSLNKINQQNPQFRLERLLSVLHSEMSKVKSFKNLYQIQCEVDPVKVSEVIPIIECTRIGTKYDTNLVNYHIEVK